MPKHYIGKTGEAREIALEEHKASGFKMTGFSYPGKSPVKLTDEEKRANLLKHVDEEYYNALSDPEKKAFDAKWKEVGGKTKKIKA